MIVHSSFQYRLLAQHYSKPEDNLLLTIAIPHYKQRRYLEVVLNSLFSQTYDNFEILVSDDCSPDDSNEVIPGTLQASGRPFRYYTHPENLGYDGNVRFCLSAAYGRYVFLLGNDDALGDTQTLANVASLLETLQYPEVAFTNFGDYSTGLVVRRAQRTQVLGSGPETAVRFFRSFSFVSGLIFERDVAQAHETTRWDQSVFYQIYLASRIIASGGRLAGLETCAVRKDVTVNGQRVPSMYTNRWREGLINSIRHRH